MNKKKAAITAGAFAALFAVIYAAKKYRKRDPRSDEEEDLNNEINQVLKSPEATRLMSGLEVATAGLPEDEARTAIRSAFRRFLTRYFRRNPDLQVHD